MEHTPVLRNESIDGLNIRPGGVYVDGTVGRGGHAAEIAKRLVSGRLIAIDRDGEAIAEAGAALKGYGGLVTFVHDGFENISRILDDCQVCLADGMIFDLGVSSPQLDDGGRGFSHKYDAPLDMRMDRRDELTAYRIVNDWAEDELSKIFFEYGEERYSRSIAGAIVRKRAQAPIETTFELNSVIFGAIPAAARREAQHPSKRCFQALRIAVNNELGNLAALLEAAPDRLRKGGRLCVISFHSLEDRIVKNAFRKRADGCVCPKELPVCACGFKPELKIITKKPIMPREDETATNPRARSAKLRITERI